MAADAVYGLTRAVLVRVAAGEDVTWFNEDLQLVYASTADVRNMYTVLPPLRVIR